MNRMGSRYGFRRGIIASDVDGTLTMDQYSVPEGVREFLEQLSHSWHLFFVTGRTIPGAIASLHNINTRFILAAQNGAICLEWPSGELIFTNLLPLTLIDFVIERGFEPLIYCGYTGDDAIYWRKNAANKKDADYTQRRIDQFREKVTVISSFDEMGVEHCASLKVFGRREELLDLSLAIEGSGLANAPIIRDPFDPSMCVLQATHREATKGKALRRLMLELGMEADVPIIAAGDDYNDISLLQEATYAITMADAPLELKELACFVAPSAAEEGIIEGLKYAIERITSKRPYFS